MMCVGIEYRYNVLLCFESQKSNGRLADRVNSQRVLERACGMKLQSMKQTDVNNQKVRRKECRCQNVPWSAPVKNIRDGQEEISRCLYILYMLNSPRLPESAPGVFGMQLASFTAHCPGRWILLTHDGQLDREKTPFQ